MTPYPEQTAPSYRLSCQMKHEIAALERLCQVVRIRGFRIVSMAVDSFEDALAISLTVEGTRPISMLQTQLEKLQTVASLELISPELNARAARSA